jgi:oligopeptide/dipeptide ABC transporter ATP-binding protein
MAPLIKLAGVQRTFRQMGKTVHAVDHVDIEINEGEILCLVGESGCGKTTTGKMVAGLLRPTGGQVLFEGNDVYSLTGEGYARYRKAVQIVHQDPYTSLNPIRTIAQQLAAPLKRHKLVASDAELERRMRELLEIVDLTPAEEFLPKYPHQLSGGQRQRVSVARALTVGPKFIVADEAVSMVDVSIRASLLKMLQRLNRELGVTFLFITHDLALAKYFAWEGRIGVMYLGRIVEIGRTPKLINDPSHPYTQALLSAIPDADPEVTRTKERVRLRSADIPSLTNLPPGCKFHPRCPVWIEGRCDDAEPELVALGDGRAVACYVAADQRLASNRTVGG